MLKANKLKKGDTIAFLAPSSPHSAIFPKRLQRATEFLQKNGYEVVYGKSVYLNTGFTAGSAEQRVEDLHNLFLDAKVNAIISTSGGLFCNDLLGKIDYSIIKQNPKIFCGYSDNTLLSAAMHSQAGLVSFYGPCAITELGEYPFPFEFTWKSFISAVEGKLGEIVPCDKGTDTFSDWFGPESERQLHPKKGYEWLHPGISEGELIGGCLPSLDQIKGTKYDFNYDRKILFTEIPEGETLGTGMAPDRIESKIVDLELSGRLDKISGLVIGRLFRQSEENERKIKQMIYLRTSRLQIPVLYGADITHGDPKTTIPIGVKAELSSYRNRFSIIEQGVV